MRTEPRLLILIGAPLLITLWFVNDGGLHNGLNRFVYEISMGVFFAAYAVLLWVASLFKRQHPPRQVADWRYAGLSLACLLIWTVSSAVFEQLD